MVVSNWKLSLFVVCCLLLAMVTVLANPSPEMGCHRGLGARKAPEEFVFTPFEACFELPLAILQTLLPPLVLY